MASGKELVRLMTCGIWKEYVSSKPYFCFAQIYDKNGKPISLKKAKNEYFCHARILFKGALPEEYIELLAEMLRMVASRPGESMCSYVFDCYNFIEIVIC